MMSDNSRRRTASRLHAYIGAVIVGGIAAIISTFFLQSQEHWGPKPSGFVFLAVLLLVSETQPMRFVRLHEGSDITISWTFAFALVLLTPVGALVVMAVASILGDLLRRKPLIRLAFNAGQMVCSLAVAALVLLLPHGFDLLETSHPSPIWFLVVGLAAICAFVTNIVLTTTVLAIHEGISPRPMMRRAVHSNLSTDGMLLALAPVFAIAAIQNLYLVPLLVAAVWNVYRAASLALRRQHEASHDALTDLPNRRQFFEHATHELAHAVRSGRSFAVAVLDLDGFKEINDRLGHHTGDLVLQEVAKRLNASRRGSDIAARFGGDEFALLLVDVDGADGAFSAVERTHEFMTQPCVVGGFPLKLAGSFGVAVYPEHGTSIDELLHHADEAMYEAKKSDSSVKRFSAPRHENHGRLALLAELERAIVECELGVHFQPKLDIATGLVVGVEALARWQHPRLGTVMPDEFITLAEQTELMGAFTARVLADSLAQAARWQQAGFEVPVAVNISARNLHDRDFADRVAEMLAVAGVDPRLLELELTENTLLTDRERAVDVMHALRENGIRIAIDDFGVGYSSLVNLRDLPVDYIKIDRSFVMNMLTSPVDAAIVASTADLATRLGIGCIAEGVETEAMFTRLRLLGCQSAQGYWIARPASGDEITDWLERTDWSVAPAHSTDGANALRVAGKVVS